MHGLDKLVKTYPSKVNASVTPVNTDSALGYACFYI